MSLPLLPPSPLPRRSSLSPFFLGFDVSVQTPTVPHPACAPSTSPRSPGCGASSDERRSGRKSLQGFVRVRVGGAQSGDGEEEAGGEVLTEDGSGKGGMYVFGETERAGERVRRGKKDEFNQAETFQSPDHSFVSFFQQPISLQPLRRNREKREGKGQERFFKPRSPWPSARPCRTTRRRAW